MKAYISVCIAGVFAFDENKKLLSYRLFDKNPEDIAKKLTAFENNETFPEIEEVVRILNKKGITDIVKGKNVVEYLRSNFRRFAIELKFVDSEQELNELISAVAVFQAKAKIKKLAKRDKLIIHAVSAMSDLDKILNLMSERLKEWYGLHYPELKKEHKSLAEFVMQSNQHDSDSIGMELSNDDIKMLQKYAERLYELYMLRDEIERYLKSLVEKEAPNLNAFLGPVLSARLIAAAGSLGNLAKLSSSGIQLLGAEKAMFRFLRNKKKALPPKHGLIALHPDIASARKEKVGKISRLLASKLILAARADFYSKEDISQKLLESYKKKLEMI